MTPSAAANPYKHHRFPGEIISHAVWLYFRFPLSHRDVEELLFVRGIIVSYEAIRKWCRKFGQSYANQLRRRRPRPGDKWHLDEVFITINREHHYLWRAVDQDGHVLDILVQRRRDKHAAKKFFRKLLKGCQYVPWVIITDKLKSYGAAKREMLPGSSIVSTATSTTGRKLTPTHPPAGAAHAGVQVPRARSTVSLRIWAYCPTLPTAASSLLRARVPSRDAEKIQVWSEITGTNMACLRVKSVCKIVRFRPSTVSQSRSARISCQRLVSNEVYQGGCFHEPY